MNNSKRIVSNRPIGIFDSGLGGLTVVKEIIRQLPSEDIVYFGDTARVPYGTKSRQSIIRFSHENTRVLLKHKVKMVVVACNSSASHAMVSLQNAFELPIVGVIKPGAKQAVKLTRTGRIGVIATAATVNSGSYEREIKRFNRKLIVTSQPCPLFVPLVEEGWLKKPATKTIAREYLGKLKKSKVDVLILGCTHYPLLKSMLKTVVGRSMTLIDSAKVAAGEVKTILAEEGLYARRKVKGKQQFLISDESKHFKQMARRFLNFEIKNVRQILNV